MTHEQIAIEAYDIWKRRFDCYGPDQTDRSLGDWYLAERILKHKEEMHHED